MGGIVVRHVSPHGAKLDNTTRIEVKVKLVMYSDNITKKKPGVATGLSP